jgi:hypothetical protein
LNTAAEVPKEQAFVKEAVGPSLTARQAAAATILGVISLLLAGVLASVLGSLADEHRLTAAGIGQCAMLEALTLGGVTGLAAAFLPARRMKLIGIAASAILGILDLATMGAQSGGTIFVLRALAGLPEGMLLWITIGMIARSEVPARWAGVFLTTLVSGQLAVALLFAVWIIPRYGANGAFAVLALASFSGIAVSFWAPDGYAPLPKAEGETGTVPMRGWVSLLATLIILAAISAVSVYLLPLAHEAGLSTNVGLTAVSISLATQIPGGSAATLLAHRLHYFPAFIISALGFIAAWIVFDFQVSAWFFYGANILAGFMTLFIGPFIVPMTIEADPTRRAAMQSAGAQVLGGALGPLIASFLVGERDAHGVVALGIAMIVTGTAIVAALRAFAARERLRLANS